MPLPTFFVEADDPDDVFPNVLIEALESENPSDIIIDSSFGVVAHPVFDEISHAS